MASPRGTGSARSVDRWATAMTDLLVEARHLTKRFGTLTAVDAFGNAVAKPV